jgi:hypothetical protein
MNFRLFSQNIRGNKKVWNLLLFVSFVVGDESMSLEKNEVEKFQKLFPNFPSKVSNGTKITNLSSKINYPS